jgi:hypothetical protein
MQDTYLDENGEEAFWEYVNEPVKFWGHSYEVILSEFSDEIYVNADNEQEALDYAIDYAEEQGWMGLFIDEPTEEDYETQIVGGNHSLVCSSDNVFITRIE